MNKLFLITIVCLQTLSSLSQNIVVVDSTNKFPLSFVSIQYGNSGFYTNELGLFSLNKIKGENIELSMLGYKTKRINIHIVKDTICLSLEAISLNEVILKKKDYNEILKIKPPKEANNYGEMMLWPKSEKLLILTPNELYEHYFIENITINFAKKHSSEIKNKDTGAVVRINIYEIKDSIPLQQIYVSKPIKISSFLKQEVVLDLSNELITIPNEGIGIGLEMIGYYDKDYNETKTENQEYVRVSMTAKNYKGFNAVTYFRYLFDKEKETMISMKDFIKKGDPSGGNYERNLSIGMSLYKIDN